MNYFDVILGIILIIAIIKGYMKGLVKEIFSFIGFFIGLFAAIEFTVPVAERFFQGTEYFQIKTAIVFVIIFVGVVILTNLLAKVLKKFLDITFLGFFDNILGALASTVKLLLMVSVLMWVFDSIGLRLSTELQQSSVSYGYVQAFGPKLFDWIGQFVPSLKEMIDSLENIKEKPKSVYSFLYI